MSKMLMPSSMVTRLRVVVACLALAGSGLVGAAESAAADATAMLSQPTLAPTEAVVASAADRLRDDPIQMAPVPIAAPLPPVALSDDELTIAHHISRTYRVANDSIERFVHYAFKAAREFRLDPYLVLAVMAVESSFNPEAQSSAGAQGLMQVLTRVHTDRFEPFGGPQAAWDPVANIKVGASILSEYVRRYGDVATGLKAYVGAALLDSDGGYGAKVMSRRAEFDSVVRPKSARTLQSKAGDRDASGRAGSVASSGANAGLRAGL